VAAAMSRFITHRGVEYARFRPLGRAAIDRLTFDVVHEFLPSFQGASFCGVCFCPYDDWRHLTPIAPCDRLFTTTQTTS
jgi:hypothetical protein